MRQQCPLFVEHLQRQRVTRAEPRPDRHARRSATLSIPGPLLRKIQAHVDQRMLLTGDVTQKHAHLAVIDFAQATAPLPRHADRVLPLLGERRRIEDDHAIGLANSRADLFRERRQQRLVVPRREANELLQALSFLIVQVGDGLAGLAFELREQPPDVLARVPALRRLGEARGIRTEELVEPCQRPRGHLGPALS